MNRFVFFKQLIKESLKTSIQSITTNKLRAVLSLLGITIGIFSVIVVLSFFQSMEKEIRKQFEDLGSNVLYIQKWPWSADVKDYAWWDYMKRPESTYKEMELLAKNSNIIDKAAFYIAVSRTAKNGNKKYNNASIVLATHDFHDVYPYNIDMGRYFTASESYRGIPVAVVGSKVATELFGTTDILGKKINVFGSNFTIIGKIEKSGSVSAGSNYDEWVILPYSSGRNYINFNSSWLQTSIIVKAKPDISNDQLRDELTFRMRKIRELKPTEKDNFAINEMSLVTNIFDNIFRIISIISWIIGSFSLLIGGFGIATIMFISVRERTPQIGIKKALGAKSFFVLLEFLFESIFLALIGGIVGLLLVFFVTAVFSAISQINITLSITNIVIGILVSTTIGLISGFFPAWKASRIAPVEAMRKAF